MTVVDPSQTRWIANSSKMTNRIDAKKLAKPLRVGMVSESYVQPPAIRKRRVLVRGRKKFLEQRIDGTIVIHTLLIQLGTTYDGSIRDEEGLEFLVEVALDEPSRLVPDQRLELFG